MRRLSCSQVFSRLLALGMLLNATPPPNGAAVQQEAGACRTPDPNDGTETSHEGAP
ncbi:MAG TPA: hypothetical protein VK788_09090 [Terriglobales bacterium]|jgi:hypothetical protein|nr:hypothetical protein [Terriglobales bacterium]